MPAATVQVTVQPCGLGQVPSSDNSQCTLCPSSTYSFDPLVDDCKPCPSQATCMGGATLVPQQQFWHSAPDSDHIITCPNNNACAGSTAALLACQNATYQGSLDVTQVTMRAHNQHLALSVCQHFTIWAFSRWLPCKIPASPPFTLPSQPTSCPLPPQPQILHLLLPSLDHA